MKKALILLVFVCFISSICVAQTIIGTDGLTEEQRAQLALQVAQMKKDNNSPATSLVDKVNPEELNKWVDLGKNIGVAIAATAKELGVAADEFLKTNTGKLTVALIVWHIMGPDILGAVGGTIAWFILVSIVIWSFRYFHMKKKVVNKKDSTVEYVKRHDFESDDARTGSAVVHVIAFVAITIACGIIIFP
ncbi:MAG: hypothetical protein Q8Q06_00450 [bacterium]|nr:hypothetical protein [bacterium]